MHYIHSKLWSLRGCSSCRQSMFFKSPQVHIPLLFLDKWFVKICLNASFNLGPVCTGSHVPSHLRPIRAIPTVESIKVETKPRHMGSRVPSMTWILTWQHFLEVRLGTCVESWVKKGGATLNTSLAFFLHNIKKDLTLMIIRHILMVSRGSTFWTLPPCWDLLTLVGLGTWEMGPHVNRSLYGISTKLHF
jgi:hypothetical protein